VAPRPRSSAPPDGELDRRTGARGLGPRPPRPPGGLLARRQARLRRGLPRTAALPYLPRLGALPGKGLVQVDRWSPEIAARLWGWSRPTGLTTDRGALPGSGTAPAPSLAVPDAISWEPGLLTPEGFPDGSGFAVKVGRGLLPGEPSRERRLAPLPRHGTAGPARPGLPPIPPAWPDPDSPVAGCPGEPRMVPPPVGHPSAGPCKHRTRTPPRTVPWPTSPGHRPRLVGLRAGRRRPEPERGQEAPLWARTRSNHGPGGTGHGPVCWDVVLRVCSPRCCHLPCAPVARVRQTRVPCPPRSPSFHRNKRGPGRFSTQVPGTGTRNR
jgi:hypothetical protein